MLGSIPFWSIDLNQVRPDAVLFPIAPVLHFSGWRRRFVLNRGSTETMPGRYALRCAIPAILVDQTNGLTGMTRDIVAELCEFLGQIDLSAHRAYPGAPDRCSQPENGQISSKKTLQRRRRHGC